MLFSSLTFLFVFLPIILLVYYISQDKYKNYILLLFSLLFYSWGEPKYIILMLLSIFFNYYFAIFINRFNNKKKRRKIIFIFSIIFNIVLLFAFKYLGFFSNSISSLFSFNIPCLNISLPIGISFYTFQILSYVIDVYKKNVDVQKNIFYLGTYIVLFPQLIAGPIVRYSTIEKELKSREHTLEKFSNGIRRFIVGLGKKVIIANNVAVVADAIFNNAVGSNYNGLILIIGTLAYTFQIYFDFSGYSDMAIGLGKMFGFEFLENFNYPYISRSITEFWRRWHMSLSTWFRDYVYIPLGGNRVSKLKWIRNIVIVWALTGLWHGASWNFVIWGLYFAVILLLEKIFLNKLLNKIPSIFRWIYSFILINIGWIIFRSENMELLTYMLKNIINFGNYSISNLASINYSLINYIPFMVLAFIFSFPLSKKINDLFYKNNFYLILKDILIVFVFLVSVCMLISNSYNPFIYFRF